MDCRSDSKNVETVFRTFLEKDIPNGSDHKILKALLKDGTDKKKPQAKNQLPTDIEESIGQLNALDPFYKQEE